jgi:hypothetical protein
MESETASLVFLGVLSQYKVWILHFSISHSNVLNPKKHWWEHKQSLHIAFEFIVQVQGVQVLQFTCQAPK